MEFRNRIKQKWADLLLGDFTPHTIALGLTVGTFVALLPTFGFGPLVAVLLMFMFPKINKPAVFIALMIWNPLVQIPIYALSYQLGSVLFSGMSVIHYDIEILNQIYHLTRRFLVAHMIIALTISTVTYFVGISYLTLKLRNFERVS